MGRLVSKLIDEIEGQVPLENIRFMNFTLYKHEHRKTRGGFDSIKRTDIEIHYGLNVGTPTTGSMNCGSMKKANKVATDAWAYFRARGVVATVSSETVKKISYL